MNADLLAFEMKKRRVTIGELCEIIGISRSSFYRKCREQSQFTQREIRAITDVLELDNPMAIFFAD